MVSVVSIPVDNKDMDMLDTVVWFGAKKMGQLSAEERWEFSALFWITMAFLAHYLVFCIAQPFYIEDAGISFAYAKNFVEGEGFVTYPGGERVEGFSNPLWTFLLAGWYAMGVSVWVSSKIMGAVFGALTLPFVFALVKRANIPSRWAMFAPFLLVLSPNYVIWAASGLENSLYLCVLAGGMWRIFVESEEPHAHPWSAIFFCLAAMTRPEGMMYAGLAGCTKLIFMLVDKQGKRFLPWILWFGVPFFLYQWWRYSYFAWPYPNTYYAKLGQGTNFKPFLWTGKGWKYLLEYLTQHKIFSSKDIALPFAIPEFSIHQGLALPFLLVAMVGWKERWQKISVVALTIFLSTMIMWDGKIVGAPGWWMDIQKRWVELRVYSILATALGIGVVSLFSPGWRVRSMLWLLGSSSVFFVIYSGGDWMKAHRWCNTVELFLLPVLFLGVAEMAKSFSSTVIWNSKYTLALTKPYALLYGMLALFAIAEIQVSTNFAISPETTVSDVHRRVRYMQWVQKKLDLDHVTLLDVDMGAHMYYSGWDIVDTAGLVDVPIARHSDYNQKFMREYVFLERKPQFAHSHGGWANTSKVPKIPEFKKDYIEIFGYPVGGRKLHIGNHIRKDIFVKDVISAQLNTGIVFGEDIRLLDVQVPSPEIAMGGALMVISNWQSFAKRDSDIQVLFALEKDGEIVSVGANQPGYRWYSMTEWGTQENVELHFPVPIPKIEEGSYRLLLSILDTSTAVNYRPNSVQILDDVREIQGMVWLDLHQEITVVQNAKKFAEEDSQLSLELAKNGECEQSWQTWKNATRHVFRNEPWQSAHSGAHKTAVAECYLEKAKQTEDTRKQIDWIVEARKWDHHIAGLEELARPIAEAEDIRGQELFALEDWEGSYEAFANSMALMPNRAHTRKRTEEARDKKLGIVAPHNKKKSVVSPVEATKPNKERLQ